MKPFRVASLSTWNYCLALLLLVAPGARAADTSVLTVTTDLYLLIAETTMVTAEQEPDTHAARAKTVLQRLDASLPAAIATVAGSDADTLADLKMQWTELKSAYEGRTFGIAFRENSYDTNLTARYTSGSTALLAALDKAATAEAERSPVQALRLRTLKTISAYLQTSTGIVGGTSFSANDADNDIPGGVAAVDKGLAQLKTRYAGKPEAAVLKGAAARWQFLRPTLLKAGGQSTPYIVYMHGLKVVQALDELARPQG